MFSKEPMALATPWIQVSSLQNYNIVSFCCLKPTVPLCGNLLWQPWEISSFWSFANKAVMKSFVNMTFCCIFFFPWYFGRDLRNEIAGPRVNAYIVLEDSVKFSLIGVLSFCLATNDFKKCLFPYPSPLKFCQSGRWKWFLIVVLILILSYW